MAEPGREDLAAAGEALAANADLVAPALVAWEIANVVHVKRPAAFGPDVASRHALVEALLEGVEQVPPDAALLAACAQLAAGHRLSAYDAAYLALAAAEDAPLVTEDARLRRAAQKELGVERAWRLVDALRLAPEDEA